MPLNKINENFIEIDKQNYIGSLRSSINSNSDNGWTVYADSPAINPIDGLGGIPGITLTQNFSNPLSGESDLRLTKDNTNRQGQGFSYGFQIDNRHLGKVLQITFDSELISAASGTYNTNDVRVYIVQDSSGTPVVIEPVNTGLQLANTNQKIRHIATFQTHVSIRLYRLCIHIATNNVNPYVIDFANFRVWEPTQSIGAVITDWQNYTPTITQQNGTVIPNIAPTSFRWRRNGSSIEIQGRIGGPTGSLGTYTDIYFSLPSGITGIADGNVAHVGTGYFYRHGSTAFQSIKLDAGSTFTRVRLTYLEYVSTVTQYLQFTNTSYTGTSSDYFYVETVPIQVQGWGSSVAMSSDTGDGRIVSAIYSNCTSNGATGGTNGLRYLTQLEDTHSIYNTSTGAITIPINGTYSIKASAVNSSGTNGMYLWRSRSGGVQTKFLLMGVCGVNGDLFEANVNCLAGDVLYVSANTATTFTPTAFTEAFISIHRISAGSQVIATSETVAASYYSAATQTSLTTQINFGTMVYDTHGAVTTGSSWRFTAPMSGKYLVTGQITFNTINIYIQLYKTNNLFIGNIGRDPGGNPTLLIQINLLAGEWIDIRPSSSTAVLGNSNYTSTDASNIQITRIGN